MKSKAGVEYLCRGMSRPVRALWIEIFDARPGHVISAVEAREGLVD